MKLKQTGCSKQRTKAKVTRKVGYAIWEKKTLTTKSNINNK